MKNFGIILGGLHVKSSRAEFSKSDRADEVETVKLLELLYDRHFRVVFIGSALLALQQLSGINVVFYFYSNIFKSSGVPSDIANMSVGVVNLSGYMSLSHTMFFIAFSMAMQAVAGSTLVSGSSVVYLSIGGVLIFKTSGYKFLCWFAISAVAGTTWGPDFVQSSQAFACGDFSLSRTMWWKQKEKLCKRLRWHFFQLS
ncbi:hypothetical protein L6452_42593 [Arctium lappa]|uniref:Uncharacterized protein n=1 Tax=Arctium lappa TaxID=4217 RepID=A0ACB8XI23_ARCLA|nr:hypothetical protein L6452_42593 [Arctium lappa]